ncbi:class I SAM-dependent methyltransferase [Pseudomonas sp. F1_0610]|uniref:methyltransferase n=1 Tax=Pseudomonas sp. F1_0610 TaxID=3114284 RepID=UPI0039C3B428
MSEKHTVFITWQEQQWRWLSENQQKPPKHLLVADDNMNADVAFKHVSQGNALVWQGDFQNARQLLQAVARRIDKRQQQKKLAEDITQAFHQVRQRQAQKAQMLGLLLLALDPNYVCTLRRAPDVSEACTQALGPSNAYPCLISLRQLQGLIGAYEWRRKGVFIPALNASIYPHYAVFAPMRSEYLDLLTQAKLPANCNLAMDIGTGTGVLAAMLAKRGIAKVLATDINPSALACAQQTKESLALTQIDIIKADLFPDTTEKAQLIVCNPPWLPGKPSSAIEYAVYDPDSRMLKRFLNQVTHYLAEQGQVWLILSDLAERLGLRSRETLLEWISQAGLCVQQRLDIQPNHKRSQDQTDPLHSVRSAEVTSLWILLRDNAASH